MRFPIGGPYRDLYALFTAALRVVSADEPARFELATRHAPILRAALAACEVRDTRLKACAEPTPDGLRGLADFYAAQAARFHVAVSVDGDCRILVGSNRDQRYLFLSASRSRPGVAVERIDALAAALEAAGRALPPKGLAEWRSRAARGRKADWVQAVDGTPPAEMALSRRDLSLNFRGGERAAPSLASLFVRLVPMAAPRTLELSSTFSPEHTAHAETVTRAGMRRPLYIVDGECSFSAARRLAIKHPRDCQWVRSGSFELGVAARQIELWGVVGRDECRAEDLRRKLGS